MKNVGVSLLARSATFLRGGACVGIAAMAVWSSALLHCSEAKPAAVGRDGGASGCAAKNAEGICLPSEVGVSARSGATPGDSIANYKFSGIASADTSKPIDGSAPLEALDLYRYFDPSGAKVSILHITVGSVWCGPCQKETEDLAAGLAAELAGQKVVFVQALADGAKTGTAATEADLRSWVNKFKPNFSVTLDPRAEQLGAFFDASAVPFNLDIDARSMEILGSGVGYLGREKLKEEVVKWVEWQKSNPAKVVK